jgi:hypothetical protein
VEEVQYFETDGGRPLTWTGLKPPTRVHTFVYRDGSVLGALQVTIRYDGETNFSQHLVDINRKPPQETIDATRPVMRWIEEALQVQCGMAGLVTGIDEHCSGVECPPLGIPPNRALQPTRAAEPNGKRELTSSGPRG